MKPLRKCKRLGCKANAWITEYSIFAESSLKSRILTAVSCTKVHSHRSFAHPIFDKCYQTPIKTSTNRSEIPEGSKNGLHSENAINPQWKWQSRAHFAHVFEPGSFFKNYFNENVSRANTWANCCVFLVKFWIWVGFCSAFWKHYKTAARRSKVPFGAYNFGFESMSTAVFEKCTQ